MQLRRTSGRMSRVTDSCPPVTRLIRSRRGPAQLGALTSKNAWVALATRPSGCSLTGSLIQGVSAPPLNRLKYPPRLLIQSYNSGIDSFLQASNWPCRFCRKYCETADPPCLCGLSKATQHADGRSRTRHRRPRRAPAAPEHLARTPGPSQR